MLNLFIYLLNVIYVEYMLLCDTYTYIKVLY